ncbi:hypothetical protein HPB51_019933 [Rhipicephalus microplus]|uniref:Uncharacterized protein n=1 Tax=Rhipicephalus microplus TaxID=6941 RepID=A0A9J6E3D4_RHIMP|nr:hypothetical protein HPB51_019933 [Rhipicephalus microplus]
MKGAVVLLVVSVTVAECSSKRPGEWMDQDPLSDPKYMKLAHYALIDQEPKKKYYYTVLNLLEVKTQSSASFASSESIIRSGETSTLSAVAAVNSAQHLLQELCTSTKLFKPTPDIAADSLNAGYTSRVLREKIDCECSVSLVLKTKESSTSATDGLVSHQDRRGLSYPTAELMRVLDALKRLVDVMLLHRAALL